MGDGSGGERFPIISISTVTLRSIGTGERTAAKASSISGFWWISEISSLVQSWRGPAAFTARSKTEEGAGGGGVLCTEAVARGMSWTTPYCRDWRKGTCCAVRRTTIRAIETSIFVALFVGVVKKAGRHVEIR
jgi:hypothetical protein